MFLIPGRESAVNVNFFLKGEVFDLLHNIISALPKPCSEKIRWEQKSFGCSQNVNLIMAPPGCSVPREGPKCQTCAFCIFLPFNRLSKIFILIHTKISIIFQMQFLPEGLNTIDAKVFFISQSYPNQNGKHKLPKAYIASIW